MVVEMSIIAQNIADKPIKVEFQTMIIRSKQEEKKELMFSAKAGIIQRTWLQE